MSIPLSFRADRVDMKGRDLGWKRDLEAAPRRVLVGGRVRMYHTGPVAIVAKTVGIPRAITPPIPWSSSSLPLLDDVRSYFDSPSPLCHLRETKLRWSMVERHVVDLRTRQTSLPPGVEIDV